MAGKGEEETLLKIFLKMLHNHQGFYGDNPEIAYMENTYQQKANMKLSKRN